MASRSVYRFRLLAFTAALCLVAAACGGGDSDGLAGGGDSSSSPGPADIGLDALGAGLHSDAASGANSLAIEAIERAAISCGIDPSAVFTCPGRRPALSALDSPV